MLSNYFTTAFRYLRKNRTFTSINILGLTLGFLCFALIALYIHDELTFDMFHRDAARTYRVIQHERQEDGNIRSVGTVALRIAPESVKQLPEVDDATRIDIMGRTTMGNDPANRYYESVVTVDANFFTFFDFPLIEGDARTALQQPDAIVISERTAIKYFGKEKALGQRIWTAVTRDDKPVEFTITGIMKDFPRNSHIQCDVVFSDQTWPTVFPWYTQFVSSDWESNSCVTYFKLKENADDKVLESKLTNLVKTNYPADKQFRSTFALQPLRDVHLYSDNIQDSRANANTMKPFYLYLFTAVGFLILVIAALNYMNLSTAAALKRTREIGTRKTLGAKQLQLIGQFSGEAVLLSAISLVFAFTILQAILPLVNSFTEKELNLTDLPWQWTTGMVVLMILTGLLSSLYPAYVSTKVTPAEAIKKEIRIGGRSIPLRKMLVVAQFAISILMIASTLGIYRQLQFMRSKELGFDLNDLLVIDINSGNLRRNFENVKAEFSKVSEVQRITTSTRVPGEWKTFPITTVKTTEAPAGTEMIYVGIDHDFLGTYNIKLLAGRNFNGTPGDSTKVILTKLAVEQLNLTDPIGKIIEIPSVRRGGSIETLEQPLKVEVIGIADNFHFESFRTKMMPLVFAAPNTVIQRIDYYTLKIKTSNWTETLEKLKAVNNHIDADNPIEYTFLNSRFEEFYKADAKRGQIFLVFSTIIVLIASLGLFALVSFAMESRRKEIGIRKVMGASVESIVTLISKEFLGLVLMANVIALPVAYYLMQSWLQQFAYHVDMDVITFALSALIALVIALGTISFRSIRAAISNPVNALRNE